MYKMVLSDGTEIPNLTRLNPSTFSCPVQDSSLYFLLDEGHLAFVTLFNDNELEDVWIDCKRQNFSVQNGVAQFRLQFNT